MLSYLLASDPATSPETLEALAGAPNLPRAARLAVLTHPALAVDAPIADPVLLSAAETHQVLTCERTSAARRAQILATLREPARAAYLSRYSDMSTAEIDTYVGDPFHMTTRTALGIARNRRSPRSLVNFALRLLAATGTEQGMTLLVLAQQHDLGRDFMVTLATLSGEGLKREAIEGYLQASGTKHTPIAHTLAGPQGALRRVVSETGNADLIYQAASRGDDRDRTLYLESCPPDHHGDAIRDLLGQTPPRQATDDDALEQLAASAQGPGHYISALSSPLLTERSLLPIFEHSMRTRHQNRDAVWALIRLAGHPACPQPLAAQANGAVSGEPRSKEPFWEDVFAEAIADHRAAGSAHPAQHVSMTAVRELEHVTRGAGDVTLGHLRDAVTSHPTWPLTPAAAAALLSVEEQFTGTVAELLDTVAAVTC